MTRLAAEEVRGFARWRWLSVAERGRAIGTHPRPLAAPADGGRLRYWRQVGDLEDDAVFARRLAVTGLEDARFATLIAAEPPGGCTLAEVESAVACLPFLLRALARAGTVLEGLPQVALALPFVRPLAPFLAEADAGLRSGRVPAAIATSLLGDLALRLHQLAEPALVLDLHLARVEGRLEGETPEERFSQWVRAPDLVDECLRAHPLLGRLLAETSERAVDSAIEMLARVAADRARLEGEGLLPYDAGPLVGVEAGLSDPHRGGRSVACLVFMSGARLVYKPRALATEALFQRLLAFLNAAGGCESLRTTNVLDLGTHGYMEFIAHAPCADAAALRRFFRRQGAYLTLLHALRAADLHRGNLIACGEHPVLVDLECLFHAEPPLRPDASGPIAPRPPRSVLSTGLTPMYLVGADALLEIGGLGGRPGQLTPSTPAWQDRGTDLVHLAPQRTRTSGAQNLPWIAHMPPAEPTRHADDLLAGCADMHALLRVRRDVLVGPGGLLNAFREVLVRHVVRGTAIYAQLLADATHPDFLRSGADRDLAFERLWRIHGDSPTAPNVVQEELSDLWCGDVPLFHVLAGGTDLAHASGGRAQAFATPSLEEAVASLRGWNEDDLHLQRFLLASSMAVMAANLSHPDEGNEREGLQADREMFPTTPASADELHAEAIAIADQLLRAALRERGEAHWYGALLPELSSEPDRTVWQTVGCDLYDGSAGIALFLAQAACATGKGRFADAALEAIHFTVRHHARIPSLARPGAFLGGPSVAFAFVELARLLARPALADVGAAILARSVDEIDDAPHLDVLQGAAGTALIALRLHARLGDPGILGIAMRAGERLLREWPAEANMPSGSLLGGLSHGSSGIAWAAAELYAIAGDDRFERLARTMLAHERALYLPARGNWRDLRARDDQAMVAFCHGAPGICLARLGTRGRLADPILESEIEAALTTTRTRGGLENESLCHGTLGNADVLLVAAARMARPELANTALCFGTAALRHRRGNGRWRGGGRVDVEQPGMLLGLAGIGHAMLRLADPEGIPSTLALDLG